MIVSADLATTGPDPFWTGPVVAAFVASGVALVTAASLWFIAKGNHSAARREERIRFRLQQLNEFYEPLAMLRMTSKNLRRSLPEVEADGSKWRLVRHVDEVKADQQLAPIVGSILGINAQSEDLLINKAGLMEGDRPPSFERFMHHSRLLRIVWDEGGAGVAHSGGVTTVEDVPFPDDIDDDIEHARQAVPSELNKLHG